MDSVTRVWIRDLYGVFDHEIHFDETWPFVIVYGPNGVGKTTFFEAIYALGTLRPRRLRRVHFTSAGIEYASGARLTVRREEQDTSIELLFELHKLQDESVFSWRWPSAETGDPIAARHRRLEARSVLGPWNELGDGTWEHIRNGELVTDRELESITGQDLDDLSDVVPPDEIESFVLDRPVRFIETQRLLSLNPTVVDGREPAWQHPSRRRQAPPMEDTVAQYARDLRERLNQALVEYSKKAQELDRSFPRRLLEEEPINDSVSESAARIKHSEQNDKRERLEELRLTPGGLDVDLPAGELDPQKLKVLSLYLEDSAEKLKSFDEVLDKVNLLKSIVNKRFLRKHLAVHADVGLQIISDSNDRVLDPSVLSSGEKHELVMFYDLIFSAEPGTLVLIDEPEISLHVSWQRQFLNDIAKVAELTGIRVLVATHSPQIIGPHIDRTHELGSAADLESME